ncbi:unnamed protein product [Acanthoscelides obtectus]|uniref:Uncharacterized protein n=1 Tax=Acanthoscelides obtectus TaxID=200917 RepID=A0A9P0LY47_ACAOB|nr:unnamed protein product [Acanthoscelides obtectus]CAK1663157.1 hypothetical protein AOBTE_LOCUS23519 [Acanthoscelides obtectus]
MEAAKVYNGYSTYLSQKVSELTIIFQFNFFKGKVLTYNQYTWGINKTNLCVRVSFTQ